MRPEARVGTLLADRYELIEVLRVESFATYYRAIDTGPVGELLSDRHVSLKLYSPDFVEFAAPYLGRSAEAQSLLQHPGIFQVRGFELVDGTAFVVMQDLSGQPLAEWLEGAGRDSNTLSSRAIALGLLDALAYAHGRGVAHRALSAEHVRLRTDGPAIFGFDPLANPDDVEWRYRAPELWSARDSDRLSNGIDYAPDTCDVFSLGVLLFELISRRSPYDETGGDLADQHRALKRPKGFTAGEWRAIHAALDPNPKKRTPNASALRQAFSASDESRSKSWVIGSVVATLGCLALIGGLYVPGRSIDSNEPAATPRVQEPSTVAPGVYDEVPKVALLIGNGAYTSFRRLKNPANDARAMAAELSRLGFQVDLVLDASEVEMRDAITRFGRTLVDAGESAVSLFYFSGHGIQSEGTNYLLSVGSEARTESEVWREPSATDVIRQIERARSAVSFVVLDACRDNPLPSFFGESRSAARGLAETRATRGMLIAYATAPGMTASDGGLNRTHSPYTEALIEALGAYGSQPAEIMFKRVADRVSRSDGQLPWYESGLTGADFCFAGCAQ